MKPKKIKDKQVIYKYLTTIVIALLNYLPEELSKKLDVTFYFEMNSISYVKGQLCFATCRIGFGGGTEITFFIDLIATTGTTKQGLTNLVVHEVAHAFGMDEKQVHKLTEGLKKKLI